MANIFMSIKPFYANQIISGKKLYEYRTIRPKQDVMHIVIYASSPLRKILGIAYVEEIIAGTASSIWHRTNEKGGIDENSFFKYFCGRKIAYAYKLSKVRKLAEEKSPAQLLDNFLIPQSFSYINDLLFDRVVSLC
jgi:predicted transcriptional regulator